MPALAFVLLFAQIGFPGQGPGNYPPGTYPPGSYPPGVGYPGGTGIPLPSRRKSTSSKQEDKDSKKAADQAPVETVRAIVRTVDAKSFEIEAEDTRHIIIQYTEQAPKPASLTVGEPVEVDMHEDEMGAFFADGIRRATVPVSVPPSDFSQDTTPAVIPEGGPDDRAVAGTRLAGDPAITTLHGPKYDAGDDGPPKLKRGKPAQAGSSNSDDEQAAAPPLQAAASNPGLPPVANAATVPVAAADPSLAAIDKAREFANNFLTGLPNYICHQHTTRYISEGRSTGWDAQDVVSVEVVYDGGKENYRNLEINGKPSNKPADQSGAWSTGEFGTILRDLFSPETHARWVYRQETRLGAFPAALYDFTVDHRHSHWKISIASQWVAPSYKGSVWIDKKSGHVLRIEMQASNLPKAFPEDTAEAAVDYDYVRLGTNQFFLPIKAEILDCQRGTSVCDRNVIEFRNYQKFTGQSTIEFNQ